MANDISPNIRRLSALARIAMTAADNGAEMWSPLDVLVEIALGIDRRLKIVDPITGDVIQEAHVKPVKDVELRMSAARELSAYVAPKLKQIELVEDRSNDQVEAKMVEVNKLLDLIQRVKLTSAPDMITLTADAYDAAGGDRRQESRPEAPDHPDTSLRQPSSGGRATDREGVARPIPEEDLEP
jgi:hypothetical protein